MTITVAMHQANLDHIGSQLDALGLDLRILPWDDDGFDIDGRKVPPSEVEADYVWLGIHARNAKAQFETVLAMKRVGVLQTFNAGVDDPFYAEMAARGVRICNSSAQGVAIAEYTIGQVMSVLQPIALQRQQQADRVWKTTRFREISQTRWLIVGYGPIGQALAHRIKAFGAHVSVVRRSPGADADVDRFGNSADLPDMLGQSDIVVLACPLTEATRGMAGTEFFKATKPGTILVNIARGGLIEEQALIDALDRGQVETAILDVFDTEPLPTDDPLWSHPGVRLTPHTSFAGDGGPGRWDALFLDNIQLFARGEPLIREVDPAEF